MNSVSKNILDLLKVIAQNQMQLAKKVDEMNNKLQEFFDEATTEPPVDLEEFSIEPERNTPVKKKKIDSKMFDEFVLQEKERRTPKGQATQVKKKTKVIANPGINANKIRIINGSDGSDISDESTVVSADIDSIKPTDSAKEKLRKLGMPLPSLSNAAPELADIEKAKILEAEIAREQKKADLKKPKEEVKEK